MPTIWTWSNPLQREGTYAMDASTTPCLVWLVTFWGEISTSPPQTGLSELESSAQTTQVRAPGHSPKLTICPYLQQLREGTQEKLKRPFYKNKLEFTAKLDVLGNLTNAQLFRLFSQPIWLSLLLHYMGKILILAGENSNMDQTPSAQRTAMVTQLDFLECRNYPVSMEASLLLPASSTHLREHFSQPDTCIMPMLDRAAESSYKSQDHMDGGVNRDEIVSFLLLNLALESWDYFSLCCFFLVYQASILCAVVDARSTDFPSSKLTPDLP
ncbi:hypothetical protein WISP_10392 [Willisornis vidua]|uniref:Uncharacterized protein n=1 Tax=Willisornis vidua TaxID=1566151 RepID=A0ABQ9DWW2_9PASS|nr:hypothetical protein WISP_10392 [Willisornis vidua]